MKINAEVLIAVAAIGAAVGIGVYLSETDKGKELTKTYKKKGKQAAGKVKEYFSDAGDQLSKLSKEFVDDLKGSKPEDAKAV